jgi:hypothetical protein
MARRLLIPAPIERVYDAIGEPLEYDRWWTDFVLQATGDAGPPAPGKRNQLLVKAYALQGDLRPRGDRGRATASHLLAAVIGLRRHGAVDAGRDKRRNPGDARLASDGEPPADQV